MQQWARYVQLVNKLCMGTGRENARRWIFQDFEWGRQQSLEDQRLLDITV